MKDLLRKRYPWQLPVHLSERIEHHQAEAAHGDLERILRVIGADRNGGLAVKKFRCAQIVSFCLRGAQRGGAPSAVILNEHLQELERLAVKKTWKGVVATMHDYVELLLSHVKPQRRTDIERLVAWIREDMRGTVADPKSLSQYAKSGQVSLSHLSRCFSAITGVTFREAQRRLRIENACRMLKRSDLKIGAIARLVGLRDASQFAAEFRREVGQTPMAYRQTHRR